LNGNLIGRSNVHENNGPVDQWSPLTLQSTLNLKTGDQLWVTIEYTGSSSYLYDNSRHQTHFTGFMLEEEIAASLWGFLTKIWLWMQLHLLNTHTKFQVSICKLWIRPSKNQFCLPDLQKTGGLEMGEDLFDRNSFTVWNFHKILLQMN
jgi:hypothetical protein